MLRPVWDTVEWWVGRGHQYEASKRPLQANVLQLGILSSEEVSWTKEENSTVPSSSPTFQSPYNMGKGPNSALGRG